MNTQTHKVQIPAMVKSEFDSVHRIYPQEWSLKSLLPSLSLLRVLFLLSLPLSVHIWVLESGQTQEFRCLCVLNHACGHVSAQKWLSVHMCFFQHCSQHMSDLSSQTSEPRECEGDGSHLEVSGQGYLPKKKNKGRRKQAHQRSIVLQGWLPPFPSFPSYFCSFLLPATSNLTCLSIYDLLYITERPLLVPPVPLSILHVRQLEPYMIDDGAQPTSHS